ncbi:MAG: methyltransferase [Flavobacteriales bacterium]|nr:methyltransferase [Flavobacteriales bacterium]|tara:strand:+ start:6140 stop:6781 length:642 start_codon:yes stop_codon:yes gene_type:complete
MDFLNKEILDYCKKFTSQNNKILKELARETEYKIMMPRMMSGPLMGSFLQFISYMMKPMSVLEIGTYTGYSAICLASGLQKNGHLHTIEINPELEDFAKKYFKKAKVNNQITLHIGNALDIIPLLDISFDIIFIDADKKNYLKYYELSLKKIKKGGIILIDNVLWSGKVLQKIKKNDKETREIKKLNKLIINDDRVENMMLPLRDGIMICKIL